MFFVLFFSFCYFYWFLFFFYGFLSFIFFILLSIIKIIEHRDLTTENVIQKVTNFVANILFVSFLIEIVLHIASTSVMLKFLINSEIYFNSRYKFLICCKIQVSILYIFLLANMTFFLLKFSKNFQFYFKTKKQKNDYKKREII